MLKKIGLAIAGIILLLVIVGLFLPSEYALERSITIQAPIDAVFAQVNDLRNWEKWGPWQEEDPTTKITYGDSTIGVGASYSWTSEKSGDGSLVIVESVQNQSITTDLDFGTEGKAQGHWTFEQTDDGVRVTWGMHGDSGYNLIGRYFGMMMDTMVGPYFDKGLANMKEIAEALSQPAEEMMTDKGN